MKATFECVLCDEFMHVDGIGEDNCNWLYHNMRDFKITKIKPKAKQINAFFV